MGIIADAAVPSPALDQGGEMMTRFSFPPLSEKIPVPNYCPMVGTNTYEGASGSLFLLLFLFLTNFFHHKRNYFRGGNEGVKLRDDPRYAKFFKMLSMHVPKGAVAQKMSVEGLDPAILDMAPEKPLANPEEPLANPEEPLASAQEPAGVKLKDDPKYAKFFKMLSMHLPKGAVAQKMSVEGLDPAILDMDPEKPLVASTSTSTVTTREVNKEAPPLTAAEMRLKEEKTLQKHKVKYMEQALHGTAILTKGPSDIVERYVQWYESCRRLGSWGKVLDLLEEDPVSTTLATEAVFLDKEGKIQVHDAFLKQRLRNVLEHAHAANNCGNDLTAKLKVQLAASPEDALYQLTITANELVKGVPDPLFELTFTTAGIDRTIRKCLFGVTDETTLDLKRSFETENGKLVFEALDALITTIQAIGNRLKSVTS